MSDTPSTGARFWMTVCALGFFYVVAICVTSLLGWDQTDQGMTTIFAALVLGGLCVTWAVFGRGLGVAIRIVGTLIWSIPVAIGAWLTVATWSIAQNGLMFG